MARFIASRLLNLAVFGTMIGVTTILAAHVKLSLYYESRCPHSTRFINKQLTPTINLLGGINNPYLEIELNPYGKATTLVLNGTFSFDCQHGPQECEGNKNHACALAKLSPADALAFVNCSMTLFNSPISDPLCAVSLGLDYSRIEGCYKSWEADTLLASYGIRKHDLKPRLRSLPWIVFDDKFSNKLMYQARKDLIRLVCEKLEKSEVLVPPSLCKERFKKDAANNTIMPEVIVKPI